MLYKTTYIEAFGETRVELVSNTYSDTWPMLRHLAFRKLPIQMSSQCLPLAIAILTRSYCGDVFEFAGSKIGSDYAEAIQALMIPQTNIVGVDGHNRTFAAPDVDVMVYRATRAATPPYLGGTSPLARVDWSGDFVDPETRSSSGFTLGMVQTNAALFADPFSVSVAIGLLFGRDRCGTLYVQPAATDRKLHARLQEALRIVGIRLDAEVEPRETKLQSLPSKASDFSSPYHATA